MDARHWLTVAVRIVGLWLFTAAFAVVMPTRWMQAIHGALGMGTLPEAPITEYLTRSLSALYAYHGALLVYLSFDVNRHRGVLYFTAIAGLIFGAVMLVLDLVVGMPWFWTLAEGPTVLGLCAALLWLLGRCPVLPSAGFSPDNSSEG